MHFLLQLLTTSCNALHTTLTIFFINLSFSHELYLPTKQKKIHILISVKSVFLFKIKKIMSKALSQNDNTQKIFQYHKFDHLLTLNTSEKNPDPIFSLWKSSSLWRADTACLSAWHDEPVFNLSHLVLGGSDSSLLGQNNFS